MPLIFLTLVLAIMSVLGWLYGEASDKRLVRRVSAIVAIVIFAVSAAILSGIQTALSVGVPVSKAVREYLDAARDQLEAGHEEFVADQLIGFKQRVQVTYETGAFVDAVNEETERLKAGPETDRSSGIGAAASRNE